MGASGTLSWAYLVPYKETQHGFRVQGLGFRVCVVNRRKLKPQQLSLLFQFQMTRFRSIQNTVLPLQFWLTSTNFILLILLFLGHDPKSCRTQIAYAIPSAVPESRQRAQTNTKRTHCHEGEVAGQTCIRTFETLILGGSGVVISRVISPLI